MPEEQSPGVCFSGLGLAAQPQEGQWSLATTPILPGV
jgi:hypothetical protein